MSNSLADDIARAARKVTVIEPAEVITPARFEASRSRRMKAEIIGLGNNTVVLDRWTRMEVAGKSRIGTVVAAPIFDVRYLAETYGFRVYNLGEDAGRPVWFVEHRRTAIVRD